jgi:hypothetical protein
MSPAKPTRWQAACRSALQAAADQHMLSCNYVGYVRYLWSLAESRKCCAVSAPRQLDRDVTSHAHTVASSL